MSGRKQPTVWLEFTPRAYPGGSPASDMTYRLATGPHAFPTMIEGRVTPGGWGTIERALSDWRGNPEASVVAVQCADSDGLLRALTEAIGLTAYAKAETSIKFLSEAGRHAGLEPRIVHRGYLTRPPQPGPGRTASIETVDAASSPWYALDPQAPLQKVFITRADCEAAGLVGTAKEVLGKPYNIVIGEHSDAGALDANGADARKGMVPVDDLGDVAPAQAVIPPPILTASVVGSTGSTTVHYAVSMVTADGETVWSNIVTLTNSLPTSSRDASNYNQLTWVAPPGWEAVYTERAIAFRVGGRSTNPPTQYLDLMNNDSTFVNPEYAYRDDHDRDVEKPPAAPGVGTAKTAPAWGLLVWALGYTELLGVFGSNLADGTAPARVLLDPEDQDLRTPASTAWPHDDPWIELTRADGSTIRVSGFYAKGIRLTHHRAGTVKFAVNCCGVTDTGDDTGQSISEAGEGYLWVLNELALKHGGEGYRTGPHWPLETFSDGTTVLNTTAIRAFQDATVRFIGGRGYQLHLCLTETVTLNQFEQWFNETFQCYSGSLDNGQRGLWVIDDTADPAAGRHYRHRIEIPATLPEPTLADDEVENALSFVYDWDPDAKRYRAEPETLAHADSQAIYGRRQAHGTDTALELRCTRDRATARDAMARRLLHNRVAPIYQTWTTDLAGLEQSLGTLARVTHPDGTGVDGYVDRPFFIVRKGLDPNGPAQRVELVGRDVDRAYAATSRWADDDAAATWDTASDDERAIYAFWADDDGTLPSDGAAGKEWR